MAQYHAQLLSTMVKIHSEKSIDEVSAYLLAHYDEPLVYLWDVADYPDDPMSYTGDIEITV